ncbi:MAG: hypothetical protein ACXW3R_14665 [Rhodoplanes sp.]
MIEPADGMLDLAFFRTGALKDTPAGSLFVPAVESDGLFLAGRLNEFPVLVALEGDQPFRVASPDQWRHSSGLLVEKIRFQVDRASAFCLRQAQDAPHGALILSSLGAMIAAFDDNGIKAVLLGGGSGSTQIEGTESVAFRTWQIVAGQEPAVVMFRSARAPV